METALAAPRLRLMIPTVAVLALMLGLGGTFFYLNKKKGATAGGTAAGAAAASASADEKKDGKEKEKAPVPVDVAAASVAPVSSYITSTANLVAENEVRIVAEVEGRIAQLLVDEGQFVNKGAALAVLVRDDAQIALVKATARANNARAAWRRAKEMKEKDLLAQSDYDKTATERDVADQELAEAEWRMSKTTIRAPFAGRLTARMVNAGQHLRPGDALFTVTDFDPIIARIYLPEKDVLLLREGTPVRFRLKADEKVTFAGRIRQISPVVDPSTGTVKVTIEVVDAASVVRPGAFVNVDIVRETRPAAIVLPREAVIREMREAHVFVVEKGIAKKRAVTLGLEEGDVIQALSGIKAGEKVIVAGQGSLKDGAAVKVVDGKA